MWMRAPSVGSQIGRIADLDGQRPPDCSEGVGHVWPTSIPATPTDNQIAAFLAAFSVSSVNTLETAPTIVTIDTPLNNGDQR